MASFYAAEEALEALNAPTYAFAGRGAPPQRPTHTGGVLALISELWPRPTEIPIDDALVIFWPLLGNDINANDVLACIASCAASTQPAGTVSQALRGLSRVNTAVLPGAIDELATQLSRHHKAQTGAAITADRVGAYVAMCARRLRRICWGVRPTTLADPVDDLPQTLPDALARVLASHVGFLHRYLQPDVMRIITSRDRALRAMFLKFASTVQPANTNPLLGSGLEDTDEDTPPHGETTSFFGKVAGGEFGRRPSTAGSIVGPAQEHGSPFAAHELRVSWPRMLTCLQLLGMQTLLSERVCKAIFMQFVVYQLAITQPSLVAAHAFLAAVDRDVVSTLPDGGAAPMPPHALPAATPAGEPSRSHSRQGWSASPALSTPGPRGARRRRSSTGSVTGVLKYMSPAVALGDERLLPFSLQDVLEARRLERQREGRPDFSPSASSGTALAHQRPTSPTALLRTGGNFVDDGAEGADLLFPEDEAMRMLQYPAFCAFFARCADILYDEQLFAAARGSDLPTVTEARLRARKPWDSASLHHKLHKLLQLLYIRDVAAPTASASSASRTIEHGDQLTVPLISSHATAAAWVPALEPITVLPDPPLISSLTDTTTARVDTRPLVLVPNVAHPDESHARSTMRARSPVRLTSPDSFRPSSATGDASRRLSEAADFSSGASPAGRAAAGAGSPLLSDLRSTAQPMQHDSELVGRRLLAAQLDATTRQPADAHAVMAGYRELLRTLAPSAQHNPLRALGLGAGAPPLRVVQIAEGKSSGQSGAKGRKAAPARSAGSKVSADRAPIFVDLRFDAEEVVAREEFRFLQRQAAILAGCKALPPLPPEREHLRQTLKICMNPEVLKSAPGSATTGSTKAIKNPGTGAGAPDAARRPTKASGNAERPPWDAFGVLRLPQTLPLTNVSSMMVHAAADGVPIEPALEAEKLAIITAKAEVAAEKERRMTDWLLREKAKKQSGRSKSAKPARRTQKGVINVNVDALETKARSITLHTARAPPGDVSVAEAIALGMYATPAAPDGATGPLTNNDLAANVARVVSHVLPERDMPGHPYFHWNIDSADACAARIASALTAQLHHARTPFRPAITLQESGAHSQRPGSPGWLESTSRRPSFVHRTTRPLSAAASRPANTHGECPAPSTARVLQARFDDDARGALHATHVPAPLLDVGYPFIRAATTRDTSGSTHTVGTALAAAAVGGGAAPTAPGGMSHAHLQAPTPPASSAGAVRSPSAARGVAARVSGRPPSATTRSLGFPGALPDAAGSHAASSGAALLASPKLKAATQSASIPQAPAARAEEAFRMLFNTTLVASSTGAPTLRSSSPRKLSDPRLSRTAAGVFRYPRLAAHAPPPAQGIAAAYRGREFRCFSARDASAQAGHPAPLAAAYPAPPVWLACTLPDIGSVCADQEEAERLELDGAHTRNADVWRSLTHVAAHYARGEYHAAVAELDYASAILCDAGGQSSVMDPTCLAYAFVYRAALHLRTRAHAEAMQAALFPDSPVSMLDSSPGVQQAWEAAAVGFRPGTHAMLPSTGMLPPASDTSSISRSWLQGLALSCVGEAAYELGDFQGAGMCCAAGIAHFQTALHRRRDIDPTVDRSFNDAVHAQLALDAAFTEANLGSCLMMGAAFTEAEIALAQAAAAISEVSGVPSPAYDAVLAAQEQLRSLSLLSGSNVLSARPGRIMRGDERHLATDATYVVEGPPMPDSTQHGSRR